MLFVKKYGGTSVSTPEKILEIAQWLKALWLEGHKLIVIVSAMGDTTDELVSLSRRITHAPIQREMDMLLSSGERVSMALLAIALNSIDCPAISFTGSQSGLFTDGSHNSARIKNIKPIRVQEALDQNKVVIIAGFQGVHPESKEVTTLGRGGSDTTAVAMAVHFKADRCDILTDVRGIYTIDPRISGVTPRLLFHLDYNSALEMTYWGARILHYRCVELAERSQIPILVHLSSEEGSGTLVDHMEETVFRAVNYDTHVACLCFEKDHDFPSALKTFKMGLEKGRLSTPQIISQRKSNDGLEFFISTSPENFEGIEKNLREVAKENNKSSPTLKTAWGTVTLTGRGLVNSDAPFELGEILTLNQIKFDGIMTTPLSISFLVPQAQVQQAAQVFHEKFIK